MKGVLFICSFFSCLTIKAQSSPDFEEILKYAEEVQLTDSLYINVLPDQKNRLDSTSVKKWFFPLLGSVNNNRLKNRSYFLTGKITSNPKFNLLVMMEEKKKNDSIIAQVVYLITTKKDGTYIASIKAAIAGTKRRSSYNTSSWLYKDYKIVLDSRMVINQKSYDDLINYTINGKGRFILGPSYQ